VAADRDLHDLRALVSGASKGIGHAVVVRLREAGATVLATARTAPLEFPNGAQFVAADVTTASGCPTVAAAVHQRLGGIDIIVHVVGGSSVPAGGFAVLGRALAESVLASGDNLVATARNMSGLEALTAPFGDRAMIVPLAVAKGASPR
jgi:NADP-dependent 3-hydroxy acid dehydrogenase YdfG